MTSPQDAIELCARRLMGEPLGKLEQYIMSQKLMALAQAVRRAAEPAPRPANVVPMLRCYSGGRGS